MSTPSLPLMFTACLCTLLACSKDDGGDTDAASTGAASEAPATDTSAATQAATDEPGTTAASGDDSTSDDATTAVTSTTGDSPTSAAETTDPGTGDTTGPAPTDGPGVLPGETGIDSFCRRYVECGGTYYPDQQACLDESFNYWGECPTRRAALDAFGGCMSELDCSEWNPDAYNPGSTPCAQQYSDLQSSRAC